MNVMCQQQHLTDVLGIVALAHAVGSPVLFNDLLEQADHSAGRLKFKFTLDQDKA